MFAQIDDQIYKGNVVFQLLFQYVGPHGRCIFKSRCAYKIPNWILSLVIQFYLAIFKSVIFNVLHLHHIVPKIGTRLTITQVLVLHLNRARKFPFNIKPVILNMFYLETLHALHICQYVQLKMFRVQFRELEVQINLISKK